MDSMVLRLCYNTASGIYSLHQNHQHTDANCLHGKYSFLLLNNIWDMQVVVLCWSWLLLDVAQLSRLMSIRLSKYMYQLTSMTHTSHSSQFSLDILYPRYQIYETCLHSMRVNLSVVIQRNDSNTWSSLAGPRLEHKTLLIQVKCSTLPSKPVPSLKWTATPNSKRH